MPPNQAFRHGDSLDVIDLSGAVNNNNSSVIRCAILGCGMMGQEHISYLSGYDTDIRLDFLCDPHEPSRAKAMKVLHEFRAAGEGANPLSRTEHQDPVLLEDEKELLLHADQIDLLVIASPNYLHTDSLMKWGNYDLTILVEKPVAVSREQHDDLMKLSQNQNFRARIWVAMEYRYIPAVAKLLTLLPQIGALKMVTIRENRYPFLHKIQAWNRDVDKTGDTLVEKCCHFFDLFRLITGQEAKGGEVRALAQRGLNYQHELKLKDKEPIIDSAYVVMPFEPRDSHIDAEEKKNDEREVETIGCLELCMYAEGSRHQEEIIVTGTKGRLEAYLPENKVYSFRRPTLDEWSDRSIPPPASSVTQRIYDCSDVRSVHNIEETTTLPTHGGYHYSSTAVEWYYLIRCMREYQASGRWEPHVSLMDGLKAVNMGLMATGAIVNEKR